MGPRRIEYTLEEERAQQPETPAAVRPPEGTGKMEPEEQIAERWRSFAQSRDPTERQELIVQYAPLVKFTVGRLAMHYPTILDADDIQSIGTVGLIEAVDRFDPERGVKFQTYAFQRI